MMMLGLGGEDAAVIRSQGRCCVKEERMLLCCGGKDAVMRGSCFDKEERLLKMLLL